MKTLKKLFAEAISVPALDQHLNAFRQSAKGGMKGPTGEYVDILELLIDWMGNRTNLSDKDLEEFMGQLKAHGYEPGESQDEPPSPKRKKAADVQKEPKQEPQGEPETKDATKDEPEVAVNKEKEPEPATKDEPKKSASIPTLKQLAGQETGTPPPLASKGKGSPEQVKEPAAQEPEQEKPVKQKKKASEPKSNEPELPALPKLQNIAKVKPIGIGVNPASVKAQGWDPGKQVIIGFMKEPFTVLGGDAARGYILKSKKGIRYIFNPSRHPKLGRGLRKIG